MLTHSNTLIPLNISVYHTCSHLNLHTQVLWNILTLPHMLSHLTPNLYPCFSSHIRAYTQSFSPTHAHSHTHTSPPPPANIPVLTLIPLIQTQWFQPS